MVMVFLDLQRDSGMSMETFVRTLLGVAQLRAARTASTSPAARTTSTACATWCSGSTAASFRLVLLLDEFETVTTNANFSLEFFSFLRYLANHYNVAYLTSSERDLQQLCHTKEISDSPFFNIFSTLPLTVFKPDEAEALIREPSSAWASRSAPTPTRSSTSPGSSRSSSRWRARTRSSTSTSTRTRASRLPRRPSPFLRGGALHFRYVWDRFDEHERSTIPARGRWQGLARRAAPRAR